MSTHSRFLIACFLGLSIAVPLSAQTADPQVQQLEQKLNELLRQAAEIRQAIDQLKGATPAPTPAAEPEDLTKVDVVPPAPPAPAEPPAQSPTQTSEQPQGGLTDVQPVNNAADPGASKVFNPDTSVIANFLSKSGQPNPYEFGPDDKRPPATLEETEVAFEAFVDPYAKAKFFLSITKEGIEVEEGFANFINLPYGLTAKVGKMKATFGKDNTWHTHVRPWSDQPLVIHNFFGDEGLSDAGVSVSKVLPTNIAYMEATGEVFSGNVGDVFSRNGENDLFYDAHLKAFKDLSENSNLELGTSYARGSLPNDGRSSQFGGIDLTYRWKPLSQGLYRGFIARFEGIANDRADRDHRLYGFYASGDYQLGQRWYTGIRFDHADRANPFDASSGTGPDFLARDHGVAATLTFWPSEFSQIRGELRNIHYGQARTVTEFLLQLQFAIGAHGAHSF